MEKVKRQMSNATYHIFVFYFKYVNLNYWHLYSTRDSASLAVAMKIFFSQAITVSKATERVRCDGASAAENCDYSVLLYHTDAGRSRQLVRR